MNARDRLVAFYSKHNPQKIRDVDALLEAFQGREEAMMTALEEKYSAAASPAEPTQALLRPTQREMQQLLEEMQSVDLGRLVDRLSEEEARGWLGERERRELLRHTLTFLQFFAERARQFLSLAHEEASGLATLSTPAPQQLSPPPATPPALVDTGSPNCSSSGGRGGAIPARASTSAGRPPSVALTDKCSPSAVSPPGSGGAGSPSPPAASPPEDARALVAASVALSHPRVVAVTSSPEGERSGAVAAAAAALCGGGCLELQPGVYYERIFVGAGRGEVEVVAAFPGAPVVLRPSSRLEPVLQVRGPGTRVTVRGIVFVVGDVPEGGRAPRPSPQRGPQTALVAAEGGAELVMEGCHVYNGAAGGVVATGEGTSVRLRLCLISLCGFAGAYACAGAAVGLSQSKVKLCECGLRAAGEGTQLHVADSTVEGGATDGVAVQDGSVCVLERTSVFNNGGSGVFLSEGSEARVLDSTIELNGMYGVHRSRHSRLHLLRSFVRDNGLLPINEERV